MSVSEKVCQYFRREFGYDLSLASEVMHQLNDHTDESRSRSWIQLERNSSFLDSKIVLRVK